MPEMTDDEVLEYLVQKVEETGVSPSMTLMIGGLVVVGGMVRSKIYYDYLSGLFDTYSDKEGETKDHGVRYDTKDPIELETLEKYSKDWKDFMTKSRDKKDTDNSSPRVHTSTERRSLGNLFYRTISVRILAWKVIVY